MKSAILELIFRLRCGLVVFLNDATAIIPSNIIELSKARTWFEFKNEATDSVDLYIYDQIGGWDGVGAKDFVTQLAKLKDKKITLRINSPGGSVFDGIAIFNALAAHPKDVIVHIDGIAASIASVIMLAGKEIHIAENAMVMIHNPSVIAWGEAKDLRKQADILDQIKETIINIYVTRTGMERDELTKLMDDETWFDAKTAVAKKFATNVVKGVKAAASFDLKNFGYTKAPEVAPPAPPEDSSPTAPCTLRLRKLALIGK